MSVYRIHTDECLAIMLSLRDIIPYELIQFIIRLYWSLYSTPVLILRTIYGQGFELGGASSINLRQVWYPFPRGWIPEKESILYKISQIRSDVRFYEIQCYPPNDFRCDSKVPQGMSYYAMSVHPGTLLIPGPVWDNAMLYPNLYVPLTEGVQRLEQIGRDTYYNHALGHVIDIGYVQWFTESLNNPEFIAAQNKLI
jgi:hypothetical protein